MPYLVLRYNLEAVPPPAFEDGRIPLLKAGRGYKAIGVNVPRRSSSPGQDYSVGDGRLPVHRLKWNSSFRIQEDYGQRTLNKDALVVVSLMKVDPNHE
ncbi:hypothetical protein J437_LFUL000909 [Ladona fulva]|uniref:Uncharacterized protein n=1 Tax=Ladona fulva TaxID=123851 RepID=A0A8K0K7P4_LADFU|nr:hypothetical protein J437_LFUL000909 [Ladona fulva]